MKRAVILFIVAALVLITIGIWIFTSEMNLKLYDLAGFGVIFMVIAFAVFIGYKRITGAVRGEPAEDELSKKVMVKASSLAYYISIYFWLAIMYFSDRITYPMHTVIGSGILGMAVIFAICWLIVNYSGVKHE